MPPVDIVPLEGRRFAPPCPGAKAHHQEGIPAWLECPARREQSLGLLIPEPLKVSLTPAPLALGFPADDELQVRGGVRPLVAVELLLPLIELRERVPDLIDCRDRLAGAANRQDDASDILARHDIPGSLTDQWPCPPGEPATVCHNCARAHVPKCLLIVEERFRRSVERAVRRLRFPMGRRERLGDVDTGEAEAIEMPHELDCFDLRINDP